MLMNVYFCGIGGAGLGPLAELAQDAGHKVQGSDPTESLITKQLTERGIPINTKQDGRFMQTLHNAERIDWFVHTSALPDDHPEIIMARLLKIKVTKRDELIHYILKEKNMKLLAIAGTHGKTRTVGLAVWIMQQLGITVSYSIGTTIPFGPSGKYEDGSSYFIYECDEFDRNFLAFQPYLSVITTVDYDHPDTYGSPEDYMEAFRTFLHQSENSVLWKTDANLMGNLPNAWTLDDSEVPAELKIAGEYNRKNATLLIKAMEKLAIEGDIVGAINSFPGVDRRFEMLAPNLYSDYGHHPAEIKATLQLAGELSKDVVLVYQPHQNLRQHQIRAQYVDCLVGATDVYWLPTFLTREDKNLPVLTPEELTDDIENHEAVHIAEMNDELWVNIQKARDRGALVLVMGAGSIDDWLRKMLAIRHTAGVLLVDMEGNYVLQKRDNLPEIRNAGKLSLFGGTVEPDDKSLKFAALRELTEETNLKFGPDDLAFFKIAVEEDQEGKPVVHSAYTITGVEVDNLEVYEGLGYEKVNPNKLNEYPLALSTRSIITEYSHPALTENG